MPAGAFRLHSPRAVGSEKTRHSSARGKIWEAIPPPCLIKMVLGMERGGTESLVHKSDLQERMVSNPRAVWLTETLGHPHSDSPTLKHVCDVKLT
jgi:hypothetical protein